VFSFMAITSPSNQPRRKTYFTGSEEQPKQFQVYQCSCGQWNKRLSAAHWRSVRWQDKACNRCGKRINLTWKNCYFMDTEAEANRFIHDKYAGEELAKLGRDILAAHKAGKIPPTMLQTYLDELYWVNKDMWQDLDRIGDSKEQLTCLLLYLRVQQILMTEPPIRNGKRMSTKARKKEIIDNYLVTSNPSRIVQHFARKWIE